MPEKNPFNPGKREPTQLWDLTGFNGFKPCLKILATQLAKHTHELLRQFIRPSSGFAPLADQFQIRLLIPHVGTYPYLTLLQR